MKVIAKHYVGKGGIENGQLHQKDATGNNTWVSVTDAKNPQYEGMRVVSVKDNPDTPKSDHSTWISDGQGNLIDPHK